jgi:hypothetical protein
VSDPNRNPKNREAQKLADFGRVTVVWPEQSTRYAISRLQISIQADPFYRVFLCDYTGKDGTQKHFSPWNMAVWVYKHGEAVVKQQLEKLRATATAGRRWFKAFYDAVTEAVRASEQLDHIQAHEALRDALKKRPTATSEPPVKNRGMDSIGRLLRASFGLSSSASVPVGESSVEPSTDGGCRGG